MTNEIIKTKLYEFAHEVIKETLDYKSKPRLRRIESFYMDLDLIFKPIGIGYPDGEEEFEYDNIHFEIEKTISESSTYSELYVLINEAYPDKFKTDEEDSYTGFDSLKLLLSSYIRLLVRNTLHFDCQSNFFVDYLGYKDSLNEAEKTYEKFIEEYKKLKPEDINKNAVSFIEEMIKRFNKVLIDDLNGVAPVYLNKIFISGIQLEQDEYKISDNITLRKIKFSDEFTISKNLYRRKNNFFRNHPSCILEFNSDSTNISVFSTPLKFKKNTKNIILDSLKLFTLNKFQLIHEIEYPISFEKQFFSENKTHKENLNGFPSLPPSQTGIKYSKFNINDSEKLAKTIELVNSINQTNNPDTDFIRISLDFFLEALSKNILSGTITYSILSLEALYNTSNKNVTENLREKCSFLLNICRDLDGKKFDKFIKKVIRKDLNNGYSVRSTYVHGEDPRNFNDFALTEKIKNYTYYSLLIFMQLIHLEEIDSIKESLITEYKMKKKIINDFIIYNSLINNKYSAELKELLQRCELFDSYTIFRE